jgi:hypothetical protein
MGGISSFDEARPGKLLSILEPSLEHFLEMFPFVSASMIGMHFNILHSTVMDILARELGLQKFSRTWVTHQ